MKLRYFLFLFVNLSLYAQKQNRKPLNSASSNQLSNTEQRINNSTIDSIPTIDLFNKYSIDNYLTQIDTSLTIQQEYKHNYFQKDLFGKVLFSNEGQFYNSLIFENERTNIYPKFGFLGKQQNYYQQDDVYFYSVATPFTEIQYRSVMEQGQILNSTFSINTSENLNFAIGYRGLRSLGRYINQVSSVGNFWISTQYSSVNKKYKIKAYYTGQDISNQENGGIINTTAFENNEAAFEDRVRFDVYLTDASSFFKGHVVYVNQDYKLDKYLKIKNFSLSHTFKYDYNFNEFYQRTIPTTINDVSFNRFGPAFVNSNIRDQARFNQLSNQLGINYNNERIGSVSLFFDHNEFNYFYNKILFIDGNTIPNGINEKINNVGATYKLEKNKIIFEGSALRSLSNQNLFNLNAKLNYKIDSLSTHSIEINSKNKIVDFQKRLFQSDYINYNWFNDFSNEKINSITLKTKNSWFDGTLEFNNIENFTFFSNDAPLNENTQLQQIYLTPKQYDKSISHLFLQMNKEFFVSKFGFDQSLIFQDVNQEEDILNLPKFILRQSSYYSNYFFKKALFLQTGFTVNYFSEYYANEYNPIIGDFNIQNTKLIGNYPVVDLFFNAKIRTFRVFIKYEHFNSLFKSNNNYAAPNQPFRDRMLRFGLTWNFFQ